MTVKEQSLTRYRIYSNAKSVFEAAILFNRSLTITDSVIKFLDPERVCFAAPGGGIIGKWHFSPIPARLVMPSALRAIFQ
jgi:hypothetical protein